MQNVKLPYLNTVMIAGRLVKDPHPLSAEGDREGSAFTVAINRYIPRKKTITTFADVICWGDTAKAVNTHCKGGDAVLVSGSLATYKNGSTPAKLQVSASAVQFLSRKEAPEGSESGEPSE